MANLEMKISVTDLEPVKELLGVLAEHISELPDEVVAVMRKIANEADDKAE